MQNFQYINFFIILGRTFTNFQNLMASSNDDNRQSQISRKRPLKIILKRKVDEAVKTETPNKIVMKKIKCSPKHFEKQQNEKDAEQIYCETKKVKKKIVLRRIRLKLHHRSDDNDDGIIEDKAKSYIVKKAVSERLPDIVEENEHERKKVKRVVLRLPESKNENVQSSDIILKEESANDSNEAPSEIEENTESEIEENSSEWGLKRIFFKLETIQDSDSYYYSYSDEES